MNKSKFHANSMLFLLILSQFIFPLIGISMGNSNTSDIKTLDSSNLDFNVYEQDSQDSITESEMPILKSSKLGSNLNNYLKKLNVHDIDHTQKIKIIIRFIDSISKQKRIEIIDSLFSEYEIISNLDLIAAVYCEVSLIDLIGQDVDFTQNYEIQKIHKNTLLSQPVITDDVLEPSALDRNLYPNWWLSAIGADNLEYDGTGVNVTVIDSGIYNHPDLNVIDHDSFLTYGGGSGDLNGHGTHVAGIIGSSGDSSGGIYQGVAPGVKLIDAKAGNVSGSLSAIDIVQAIEWATQDLGSNIISMSFGSGIFQSSPLIWDAIVNAYNTYGTIFVASAGNSGPDYYTAGSPATHPYVISVGATNKNNKLASFSSWGPSLSYLGFPDVVAPGVNIISTSAPNSIIEKRKQYIGDIFDFSGNADYIPLSGTSMSCPVVSGAIAVLKEAFPTLNAETVRVALMEGANPLSDSDGNDFLKEGAGLINVSASLEFLKEVNSTSSDVNNVTRFFPDILPVKPFDLLNFPGDSQILNLSIISGRANSVKLEIPEVDGLTLSADTSDFTFSNADTKYSALTIEIDQDAFPGVREFQINLTVNNVVMDTAHVSIKIKLPEKKVLMESYHGMNDWLENQFSFTQIGFYGAMSDMAGMNISIDYSMEFWQPNYDKDSDNYILTEERLAQYDLVVLQAPILPYSPEEITNIADYYNSGGNIIYLGTRYQEVCSENINALFSELGIDVQIKEQNIMLDEWVGLGTAITSIPAQTENHPLTQGVDKFYWLYGHSFNLTENAESIAKISNESVAMTYNGSSQGKGKFVGFGDLHWLYYDYNIDVNDYQQNHSKLLSNMMDYFFAEEDISINIALNTTRTPNGDFGLSIYVKNLTSNIPVSNETLYNNLTAYIDNGGSYEQISLTYLRDGIAINKSIDILDIDNSDPYNIIVNLTLNGIKFNKSSKILYYDSTSIPKIESLIVNKDEVVKNGNINLIADMDSSYNDFQSYISLYSYNFHNMEKTINLTKLMDRELFDPPTFKDHDLNLTSENSGYGIFYILPFDGNYFTPNSPRQFFDIINEAPIIRESTSYFQIGDGTRKSFSETIDDDSIVPQSGTQGDTINFDIDINEVDNLKINHTISVNFFMAALSEPIENKRIISLIPSDSYYLSIMNFNLENSKFGGSLTIPSSLSYSSIAGYESVSTVASAQQTDYIALLYINVIDSEGVAVEDPFVIILTISASFDWNTLIIIILVIAGIIGIAALIYAIRRKRMEPEEAGRDYSQSYEQNWEEGSSETSSYEEKAPVEIGDVHFCPFCGNRIDSPKKFCPNCGKKIDFDT